MKSQVSVEFLMLVSILILISVVLTLVLVPLKIASTSKKLGEEAKKLCKTVAFEIDTAFNLGNGYERSFFIPEKILGRNYSVSIQNHSVWITIDDRAWSCNTVVGSVHGNVKAGWNRINNTDGVIHVY